MFEVTLPPHIIVALTAIFGIDVNEQNVTDAALLPLVREGATKAVDDVEEAIA